MKHVDEQEFRAVSALPAPQRYGYFIQQVVAWREIWGLYTPSTWAFLSDAGNRPCVAVWPHHCYAEAWAKGEREGAVVSPIPLGHWLEMWSRTIVMNGEAVAVFPIPNGDGIIVTAERLHADLLEELGKYEEFVDYEEPLRD
jgi:hypothetical protein